MGDMQIKTFTWPTTLELDEIMCVSPFLEELYSASEVVGGAKACTWIELEQHRPLRCPLYELG